MRNFGETADHLSGPSEGLRSPEDELAYLRAQIREREETISKLEQDRGSAERPLSQVEEERVTTEAIHEYQSFAPEKVLAPSHQIPEHQRREIALDLEPEEHDTVMEELLWVLEHRGVLNALSVVREMDNPHIEDDFHRLLVQYIKNSGVETRRKDSKIFEALQMTLFEVLLPEETNKENTAKAISELLSNMEQFYAGMLSVKRKNGGFWGSGKEYFSLEIAVPEGSGEIAIYVAVPDESCQLFENLLTSLFPSARVEMKRDDYNIFNYDGASAGSFAVSSNSPLLPIRTYKHFDQDPMNVLLNAFSKIRADGEGAAVQILVAPASNSAYFAPYKKALEDIQSGKKKAKEALKVPKTVVGGVFKTVKQSFRETYLNKPEKDQTPTIDQEVVEGITEKIASPIFETNIRIVASADNTIRAERILHDIESAFYQFGNTRGNGMKFRRVQERRVSHFLRQFSFRLLSGLESFPLNTEELTTLFHFPGATTSSHQLKHAHARSAPAPMGTSNGDGIILGKNNFRGHSEIVRYQKEDRVRHFYAIGQTGTGKTTILKNMIVQDIQNGDGVCFIDPHGNDIDDILVNVPPERFDDVIYFDPGHIDDPMGLNMLEYDPAHPEQKTFVVNEMMSIFEKLFGAGSEGLGPMFQQYFRNSAMLVVEDPETGSTLFDISRVLSDEKFRELKLSRCRNPVVVQFWREIATKAGGEASLANIVPYITSKFDVFLANDVMRPIVAQQHSAFNMRKVMDEKKILLVNLSKGKLGEINSHLIGLIIVGKILMAALSRVDSLSAGKPNDFYLYIDEFQNVTTDSISAILSEARKYRLSLNIAHQYIAQLDEGIRNSVFGNVGSMAAFRVGSEDAQFLEQQFAPVFDAGDLMRIENRNAIVKMLVNGQPTKPFNIATLAPEEGDPAILSKLKELSYLKYGRPREEIEQEIGERYNK